MTIVYVLVITSSAGSTKMCLRFNLLLTIRMDVFNNKLNPFQILANSAVCDV